MDIRTAKDRAHRLFASGRYAKAAEAYAALVAQAPRDALLRLRLADAARRAGNTLQAVSAYRTAARILVDGGHGARARAALKLALELAPGHPEIVRALAELDGEARAASIADAVSRAVEAAAEPISIEVGAPEPIGAEVVSLPLPGSAAGVSTAKDFHRLDDHTIAFRKPNGDGWWVVHSAAPVSIEEIAVEEEIDAEIEILEEVKLG